MPDNPSVVKDASGSNYNINSEASKSTDQYLNDLFSAIQKPAGAPLTASQYNPSGSRSEVIGQVSNKTLGSLPIFGSSMALFPQAVIDQQKKAKRDAEVEYQKELGKVDFEALALTDTLNNVNTNAQFQEKHRAGHDAWLEAAAERHGGNYMAALKSLSMNKDYIRWNASFAQYAAVDEDTSKKALEIINAAPGTVTPEQKEEAEDYLYGKSEDMLEETPIDVMLDKQRKFTKSASLNDIVTIAVTGVSEDITTEITEDYNAGVGTDSKVMIKEKIKALSEEKFEGIMKNIEALGVKKGSDDYNKAKDIVKTKFKTEVDKTITQLGKQDAAVKTWWNSGSTQIDENGNVKFLDMQTPFSKPAGGETGNGTNGFMYPNKDIAGKPITIQTMSGTPIYVIDETGQVRRVRLPESYAMTPESEFDFPFAPQGSSEGWVGEPGRYVAGSANISHTQVYKPEKTRELETAKGNYAGLEGTGQFPRAQEEKVGVVVRDELTNQNIELFGDLRILVPFKNAKDQLQVAMPDLQRVHNKLPKSSQSATTGTTSYAEEKPAESESMFDFSGVDKDKEVFQYEGDVYSYNQLKKAGHTDEAIGAMSPKVKQGNAVGKYRSKIADIKD